MLYVHHVPGRIRVRVRHLKGDHKAGLRLCERLRWLGGVTEAASNPVTGSVIVHYDRRLVVITDIWQVLHDAGAVEASVPPITGGHESRAVPQNEHSGAEKLLDQLIGIVVEKAVEHSARALIALLV